MGELSDKDWRAEVTKGSDTDLTVPELKTFIRTITSGKERPPEDIRQRVDTTAINAGLGRALELMKGSHASGAAIWGSKLLDMPINKLSDLEPFKKEFLGRVGAALPYHGRDPSHDQKKTKSATLQWAEHLFDDAVKALKQGRENQR